MPSRPARVRSVAMIRTFGQASRISEMPSGWSLCQWVITTALTGLSVSERTKATIRRPWAAVAPLSITTMPSLCSMIETLLIAGPRKSGGVASRWMPGASRRAAKGASLRRVLGVRDLRDDEGRKQQEGREQQPGRQDARHGKSPLAVSPLAVFGRTGRRGKGTATKAPRIFDQRRIARSTVESGQYPVANSSPPSLGNVGQSRHGDSAWASGSSLLPIMRRSR